MFKENFDKLFLAGVMMVILTVLCGMLYFKVDDTVISWAMQIITGVVSSIITLTQVTKKATPAPGTPGSEVAPPPTVTVTTATEPGGSRSTTSTIGPSVFPPPDGQPDPQPKVEEVKKEVVIDQPNEEKPAGA